MRRTGKRNTLHANFSMAAASQAKVSSKAAPSQAKVSSKAAPSQAKVSSKAAPSQAKVSSKAAPSQAKVSSKAAPSQANVDLRATTSQTNPSSKAAVSQRDAFSVAGTSQPSESLETTSKPPRGATYCKKFWYRDDDKKYQLEFNDKGQPVGDVATTLSSSCGVVARMCNLCPIYYNDWREVKDDSEEEILAFMKERFVIPQERESIILRTIGDLWKNYKSKLRTKIYKKEAENMSKSEIISQRPRKIEIQQWRQFVNYWLSKDGKAISKKGKESRDEYKAFHTCGSKSFARKRKELEDEKGGPVGAIQFYQETHKEKKAKIADEVMDVLEKCQDKMQEKISLSDIPLSDAYLVRLEDEVLREIQGAEHPGRVRGSGRGPTITSMSLGKRNVTSRTVEFLEAEVPYLKKRDAERESDFKKMKEMVEDLLHRGQC